MVGTGADDRGGGVKEAGQGNGDTASSRNLHLYESLGQRKGDTPLLGDWLCGSEECPLRVGLCGPFSEKLVYVGVTLTEERGHSPVWGRALVPGYVPAKGRALQLRNVPAACYFDG